MKEEHKVSTWDVKVGDLVIRRGRHEACIYIVEYVDEDGILLVNGVQDEFFTNSDCRSINDETLYYFYNNFRLLVKRENLIKELSE